MDSCTCQENPEAFRGTRIPQDRQTADSRHYYSRTAIRPRKIEEHGAEIAHRLLQICGQIFSYAVVTQRATVNPAVSLRGALQPVVRQNHAYIKPNELSEYLKNP